MNKILNVLQIILRLSLIFFIVLIWTRYFFEELWLSLFLALIVTIAIEFLTNLFKNKKKHLKQLKLQEKEDAENIFLSLCADNNSIVFFHELAQTKHKEAIKKKKYIVIPHAKNNVILYPFLSFSALKPDDILRIINETKKENCTKLVIVCNEVDRTSSSFIKNFDIEIILLDRFNAYSNLYKPYNKFPEITMKYKKDRKLAFKELIAFSFNKSRTKGYLFSAFILFLSSLLIRPSLYYCIIGSLLLIFALISYSNPYFNTKIKKEIL